MERFENGSDMCRFRSLDNSTSKRVLYLLEQVKLTVWKAMLVPERLTVVKFRMDDGRGSGAGCFEVKIWADTAKFTNVIVARLRKCCDLVREGKMFVKNKTKVASGVGGPSVRILRMEIMEMAKQIIKRFSAPNGMAVFQRGPP